MVFGSTFFRHGWSYQPDSGPNSTELAIHIGHERGGWKGLIIAGLLFCLPAVLITGILAWFYRQYGQLP